MPNAEFEEKQYENAANLELAGSERKVFSPGQVLENILGYDVATKPGGKRIWDLLGVCIPPGVVLVPNFWDGTPKKPKEMNLPTSLVSLIIQYKRPYYLTTSNASQWYYWNKSYYRIQIREYQHKILTVLEKNLRNRLVVRYASAAFHEYRVLEEYQIAGLVLDNSGFVAPTAIDPDASVFTYDGPGTEGYANPVGQSVIVEKYDEVISLLEEKAIKESLQEHVVNIAKHTSSALDEYQDSDFWITNLRIEYPEISDKTILAICMYLNFARVLSLASASWWVFEV